MVQVSPEEFNIITAALRQTQMVYEKMADKSRTERCFTLARRQTNTADTCKALCDRFERVGLSGLAVSQSEYNFVVGVLETTARASVHVAAQERLEQNPQASQIAGAFSEGCRVVADKWKRASFAQITGALIH